MRYFIYCREGASTLIFARDTKLAADKKASELKEAGYIDVRIAEQPAMRVA